MFPFGYEKKLLLVTEIIGVCSEIHWKC